MARGRRRASAGRRPVVTQQLAPAGRVTRASKRERRRRRRRIRSTAATAALAVLVLAAVAVAVDQTVGRRQRRAEPPARTQQTLLFQIAGADGTAVSAALLAHDPVPGTAFMVMLPPRTVSDAPGYGSLTLGNVLRLAGPGVSRQAVSDLLLGVRVDHDWTLQASAFAALVDRLGGVVVDVDRDLVVRGPSRGTTTVLLRAGAGQRLDGATAARWAAYVGPGEDDVAALPRLQAVFEGLLAELPEAPEPFATSLAALGAAARTSWRPDALARFLDGVRDARAADRFEPAILPVAPIETGSERATYGIKLDEVTILVERTLAASVPPGRSAGDRRVIVENGVGTPGIGQSVAARLTPAGYDIVTTRNAPRFGHEKSVVVVFDASDEARQRGLEVARLLGLPPGAVQVAALNQSVADVVVIVGRDYKA